MKIARIFPRKTKATPDDQDAFIGMPPLMLMAGYDEIHISVAFTWDMPLAERIAKECEVLGVPILMGGPAFNEPGGDFNAGRYLKNGYVITSRGCPNRCWFCAVPKREGYRIRELPIVEGNNVLDDNLLACSEQHIRAVFKMLSMQKERARFTGGLEAKILKEWHAQELRKLKPKTMFFAYDTPDDYEPLLTAGRLLVSKGFTTEANSMKAYVLIGQKGDTFDSAEKRLIDTLKAGFVPFPMLYKDDGGNADLHWKRFQTHWAKPQIVMSNYKEYLGLEIPKHSKEVFEQVI